LSRAHDVFATAAAAADDDDNDDDDEADVRAYAMMDDIWHFKI